MTPFLLGLTAAAGVASALEPDIQYVDSAVSDTSGETVTIPSLNLSPGRYIAVFGGARSSSTERTSAGLTHSAIATQSAVGSRFQDGATNDGYAFAEEFTVETEGTADLVAAVTGGSLFGMQCAVYRIVDLGAITVAVGGDESGGFTSFDVTGSPSSPVMALAAAFARTSSSAAALTMTWTAEPAVMTGAGAYSGIAGAIKAAPGNTVTVSRDDTGNLLVGAGIILWFAAA